MKHVYSTSFRTSLAMTALAAASVLGLADDKKVQPGRNNEITITGHISRIQPASNRLTVQTTQGEELELNLDSRSRLELHQQEAKLSQFKQGARVRVTYEPAEGKNRVISLRDAPVSADEVRHELRDALEAAKAYAFQQKEKYQKRLEPVLKDLDDRIEILKEKAKGAGKEAQKWYGQAIEELRQKKEMVREHLAKVEAAAPGAWEEVQAGVSAAWEDLRKAFQRAHDRLKEEVSPDKPD